MNVSLDKFQQDLQKNYLSFKKASDQLKKDYAKVSNESFTEKDWNTEGRKITINMNNFQIKDKSLYLAKTPMTENVNLIYIIQLIY